MDPPDYYTKPTKFKNGKMTDLGIGRVLEYMSFERSYSKKSEFVPNTPTIRISVFTTMKSDCALCHVALQFQLMPTLSNVRFDARNISKC
ncbi:Protein CBG26635 [Caenorhabditis briggsae]|uniref:Protein CBG26635 n=1 Tax=Caenorhabditis briggsae TaxID=6238 RepID=B6IDZ9_CAEBR|nr:Protein CBG26635 [Caenorhabditis briggsae]CAS01063.1 Protein CBG26635 [Caenorhabditis briggsae]